MRNEFFCNNDNSLSYVKYQRVINYMNLRTQPQIIHMYKKLIYANLIFINLSKIPISRVIIYIKEKGSRFVVL